MPHRLLFVDDSIYQYRKCCAGINKFLEYLIEKGNRIHKQIVWAPCGLPPKAGELASLEEEVEKASTKPEIFVKLAKNWANMR